MRINLSDFRDFLDQVDAGYHDHVPFGAFPVDGYASEHKLILLGKGEDIAAMAHSPRQYAYDFYTLAILQHLMRGVVNGERHIESFLSNHPISGEIVIDMAQLYFQHVLPKYITDHLERVDWQKERREDPGQRSLQFMNCIALFDRLSQLPGGLKIGRTLWDSLVPAGIPGMPPYLRNVPAAAGVPLNYFKELERELRQGLGRR